jgi:hypothetical protein
MGPRRARQVLGPQADRRQPRTADQQTMAVACDRADGTQELYVVDAGGMDAGNSICSQEKQVRCSVDSSIRRLSDCLNIPPIVERDFEC